MYRTTEFAILHTLIFTAIAPYLSRTLSTFENLLDRHLAKPCEAQGNIQVPSKEGHAAKHNIKWASVVIHPLLSAFLAFCEALV
jgi:hypothetical protein